MSAVAHRLNDLPLSSRSGDCWTFRSHALDLSHDKQTYLLMSALSFHYLHLTLLR